MNKTVILTGGSRGIGHAAVKKFWNEGWRVITCSRTAFSSKCPWNSAEDNHFQVDLSDTESLSKRLDFLVNKLNDSPIHALINNAAISPKEKNDSRMGFLKTNHDLWKEVFDVNFFAPIVLTQKLFRNLSMGKGVVINITSIAGDTVHEFAGPAYATSKAALKTLTREMAADLSSYGIRVNAISPGEIETSMISKKTKSLMTKKIPMGRLGTPDEVAGVIFSMCSDQFSYVNGTEIQINGGQSI